MFSMIAYSAGYFSDINEAEFFACRAMCADVFISGGEFFADFVVCCGDFYEAWFFACAAMGAFVFVGVSFADCWVDAI